MRVLFIFVFFFFTPLTLDAFPFKGVQVTEDEKDVEAYSRDGISSSEFCCDREYISESAQDMSQREAKEIVSKVLAQGESSQPARPSSSGPGQR